MEFLRNTKIFSQFESVVMCCDVLLMLMMIIEKVANDEFFAENEHV